MTTEIPDDVLRQLKALNPNKQQAIYAFISLAHDLDMVMGREKIIPMLFDYLLNAAQPLVAPMQMDMDDLYSYLHKQHILCPICHQRAAPVFEGMYQRKELLPPLPPQEPEDFATQVSIESSTAYTIDKSFYYWGLARWAQLHYCEADDIVFLPPNGKAIPVSEMEDYLIRSHPAYPEEGDNI